MIANGFDSATGKSFSGIVNALALALSIRLTWPSTRFWVDIRPVMLCISAAFLWVVLFHSPYSPLATYAQTLAPDMAGAEMISYWAGAAALLCGAALARENENLDRLLYSLIIGITAILLFSLIARFTALHSWLDYGPMVRQGRFTSTIGNANVTAAIAATCALLALRFLVEPQDERKKRLRITRNSLLMCFILAINLIVMISTASRFTLIYFFLCALCLFFWGQRNRPFSNKRPALLFALLVGIAAWYLTPNSDLLSQRMERLGVESGDRFLMWRHYADLALSASAYGYGYGSFSNLNASSLTDIKLAQALWSVNSPHNIIIQLMIVGGIPYLFLITLAALFWLKDMAAHILRSGLTTRRAALIAATGAIFTSGMIDIALDYPVAIYTGLFLAGLLWQPGSAGRQRHSHRATPRQTRVQKNNGNVSTPNHL